MIVIPMAGLSRRFTDAGYKLPKYMLEAHGRTLFNHSVRSFSSYFDTLPFLFVFRDVNSTADFVSAECKQLGIKRWDSVTLDAPTAGQAETVALGLKRGNVSEETPVTIFNIDTFRPGFRFPVGIDLSEVDGYIEVFEGEGANWSYVRPAGSGANKVAETAEKRPISNLCCTGLYHFKSVRQYLVAYDEFSSHAAPRLGLKELYIAPMYNLLIAGNADIRYSLISLSEVIFCGVPAEYDAFLRLPDAEHLQLGRCPRL